VKGRTAALVMTGLLILYLVLAVQYAIVLIGTKVPIGIAMGIALLVAPLIGGWAIILELRFVIRGERLLRMLGAEGGLPVNDLPKLPSGRPDPIAADTQFPHYQTAVESEPDSWRAWLRLGLAYDASGDRRRARWATRQAIRLEAPHPSGASATEL
jgi:hypothetical protein